MRFFRLLFNNKNSSGFTLLELVFSVGILVLVGALALASYSRLNDRANLARAAKTVAGSVRKAQFYGIGVKEFETGSGPEFPAYGVYFGLPPVVSYTLFADFQAPFNKYSGAGEDLETYSILKQGHIDQLCSNYETGPADCGLTALNIVFKRPSPDIFLYGEKSGQPNLGPFDDVGIVIKSPRGDTKTVVVWKSGQISIE